MEPLSGLTLGPPRALGKATRLHLEGLIQYIFSLGIHSLGLTVKSRGWLSSVRSDVTLSYYTLSSTLGTALCWVLSTSDIQREGPNRKLFPGWALPGKKAPQISAHHTPSLSAHGGLALTGKLQSVLLILHRARQLHLGLCLTFRAAIFLPHMGPNIRVGMDSC